MGNILLFSKIPKGRKKMAGQFDILKFVILIKNNLYIILWKIKQDIKLNLDYLWGQTPKHFLKTNQKL